MLYTGTTSFSQLTISPITTRTIIQIQGDLAQFPTPSPSWPGQDRVAPSSRNRGSAKWQVETMAWHHTLKIYKGEKIPEVPGRPISSAASVVHYHGRRR